MNQDEQELIQQAQSGDRAAFASLVEIHAQFVYNLAYRTLNNAQEAEDTTQEAFFRAWRGLPDFRAEAKVRTWLYRITVNICYNRLPQLKTDFAALETKDEVLLLEKPRSVESKLLTTELREQIYTAVDKLPETYRLLITLHYMDGYSYEEIADVTQMTLAAIKSGLFRARKQLRQMLVSYEGTINE